METRLNRFLSTFYIERLLWRPSILSQLSCQPPSSIPMTCNAYIYSTVSPLFFVASLPQSTHQTPFFFFFFCLPPSNPLFPSRVSQVDSNSWAGVGSHTSLRRALILRCCSWRLKSMIESEWNLAVRLQSTHTRPEASETLFTPGLALCL